MNIRILSNSKKTKINYIIVRLGSFRKRLPLPPTGLGLDHLHT